MGYRRIYIAGCGGMLGEAFQRQFRGAVDLCCTDIDVNDDWLSYCDFRDFERYREDVVKFKPDYLFHLGAYTDLEFCERHSDDTYNTNTISVENACNIANELDIPLLYITTAGVFDGKKDDYDDWDTANTLGVYARSKYMGERFVVEHTRRHLICRAGWMMGAGPKKDKKFVQKIMKQLKEGKKELFIVDDKLGTPTYTQDFAKNVMLLMGKNFWGSYNMVCGGETGRLEVATEIVRLLHLEKEIAITPVSSDYFKKEYFAERPACERLVNRKLTIRGLNAMREWRVALKEYLEEYYRDYL